MYEDIAGDATVNDARTSMGL